MSIQINRLLNVNLYSEGQSLLGKIEEITLPSIKTKDADVNALGMQMSIKLPSGLEAMSGKMKFNAVYPELIKLFGNPFQSRSIQVRGNLEVYNSSGRTDQISVVAFLTVRFKDALPGLTFKMNDNPEQESEFNCTYYRLEIGGEIMIEVDAFANIFFTATTLSDTIVDVLQRYRNILGF
jgi:P2 family phage contractile tail tube protein